MGSTKRGHGFRDRSQKTEVRGQRTEVRRQITDEGRRTQKDKWR